MKQERRNFNESEAEKVITELKKLRRASLRDLLSSPIKTLALLNAWEPAACLDAIAVYTNTLSPLESSSVGSLMTPGFVCFTTHGSWVAEVPHVLQLTVMRDEFLYYYDPGLVDGWNDFPYWLPCTHRWVFGITNTDTTFTSRVHGAFQGFDLRAEIWQRLKPLIDEFGAELSRGEVAIE